MVILESFSAEHTGVFNRDIKNPEYKGFTPFLDSLIGQSLAFKGFANGKQSIEGIPAVLTGLPNLMHGNFITSNYSANKINKSCESSWIKRDIRLHFSMVEPMERWDLIVLPESDRILIILWSKRIQ